MGLHPAFFIVTVVAWIFAVLGVAYHDPLVRDVSLLVAVGTLALGVFAAGDVATAWRGALASRAKVRSARVKAATSSEPESPAVPAARAAEPAGETVRPPLHSLPKAPAWEADFSVGSRAAPEPAPAVAPRAAAPMLVAPSGVAASVPGGGPERLTRGICGKCQSPITVSNRRPIRVTCPMCGHSKLLQ